MITNAELSGLLGQARISPGPVHQRSAVDHESLKSIGYGTGVYIDRATVLSIDHDFLGHSVVCHRQKYRNCLAISILGFRLDWYPVLDLWNRHRILWENKEAEAVGPAWRNMKRLQLSQKACRPIEVFMHESLK